MLIKPTQKIHIWLTGILGLRNYLEQYPRKTCHLCFRNLFVAQLRSRLQDSFTRFVFSHRQRHGWGIRDPHTIVRSLKGIPSGALPCVRCLVLKSSQLQAYLTIVVCLHFFWGVILTMVESLVTSPSKNGPIREKQKSSTSWPTYKKNIA